MDSMSGEEHNPASDRDNNGRFQAASDDHRKRLHTAAPRRQR
jgi:hypothetical protein